MIVLLNVWLFVSLLVYLCTRLEMHTDTHQRVSIAKPWLINDELNARIVAMDEFLNQ